MEKAPANIKAIFDQALEISSPEERGAFLDRACADVPDLRPKVEALLRAFEEAGSFLERPALNMGLTIGHEQAPLETPGMRIGRYKLLQQIGEGGMGVVYMAEQEQPVRRMVALKVVKPGMDTAQVVARFEVERQALALMDHPNVAKVLDAGSTGGGRPYFVMELVKGIPITRFCDDNKLPLPERLALFLPVCHAVQHAHQKGIIHRDLKPSNVLVCLYDGRPVPKVIDFGVAKATGARLTERTLFTGFGQMVGTLEYMSPEQAELNQLDIDTRSDIYALGILLYELLTGSTPLTHQRLKDAAFSEVLRLIREEEPPPPSTRLSQSREALPAISAQRRTEPDKLSRLVRGDLDWIVLKALEKDRNRRYDTANGLAQDIQRFLQDEPIQARPPSTGYRLRKFARKHRGLLSGGAAIVLLLVAGTVISTILAVRATQAEREAEVQQQIATHAEELAKKERDAARAVSAQLKSAQEQTRRTLYVSDMNLVQAAWQDANLDRVDELVERHQPQQQGPDMRGFEWHYWNRLRQTELMTIAAHKGHVFTLAWSPDGKHLASFGSEDAGKLDKLPVKGELLLWDARTGALVRKMREPPRLPRYSGIVSFNAAGTQLLAPTGDGTARVWDVATGQVLFTFAEKESDCWETAFTPDGKQIAALFETNGKCFLKFWDSQTGKSLRSFPVDLPIVDLGGTTFRLSFSPDSKFVLGCGPPAARMVVWDVETGKEFWTLEDAGASGAVWNPKTEQIAVYSAEARQIHLWDVPTRKHIRTFQSLPIDLTTTLRPGWEVIMIFSPDGKRLCVPTGTMAVVFDVQTGQVVRTVRHRSAHQAAYSPDGKRLAAIGSARNRPGAQIKVYDADNDPEISRRKISLPQDQAQHITFLSIDGRYFLASYYVTGQDEHEGHTIIWETQSGREVRRLPGLIWSVSGDGRLVATSYKDDKGLQTGLWDLTTGDKKWTLPGKYLIGGFSADNKIVGAYHERSFKILETNTGKERLVLPQQRVDLPAALHFGSSNFSNDGRFLITSQYSEERVRVWNAATGHLQYTVTGEIFGDGHISPDDRFLTIWTTTEGNVLRLVELETGQVVHDFKGHGGNVEGLVYSPDSKRLASYATDFTVRLWDLATGREIWNFKTDKQVRSLSFQDDGRRLLGSCDDGTILVWDAK